MAAEGRSPTTKPGGSHAASQEAVRRATMPEEATIPPAAALALKWVGVAMMVIAGLMAVYAGAGLFGEWAAGFVYP